MAERRQVCVGVDLGGTKIQAAALKGNRVLGTARLQTPQSGVLEDVIGAIAESVEGSLQEAGVGQADLQAVGVGTPGEVDVPRGTVSRAANVPGFDGEVPLGSLVSASLDGGVPVRVDNDVRVGVLGEFRAGAGRPFRNLLGIWLGTGVGGGLVLGGKVHDGRGGAGEIGHLVVKPGGRQCSCGRRGCLEAYAGRACMEQRARDKHARGSRTRLFEIMREESKERLTSGVYARALKEKDKLAEELIADAAWALGIAMASAQNLLDVEAIVVGGGLGDRLGRRFLDRAAERMRRHLLNSADPPAALATELGDLSGAVGAALLAKPASRPARPRQEDGRAGSSRTASRAGAARRKT
jgi:glucokinase